MEEENRLYLSQSMLKDWENMCGEAFRVKYFVEYAKEEDNPFYIGNKDVIILGNVYEQNIIGISRGGKITKAPFDLVKKPVYDRMLQQAKLTKEWYRNLGGKAIGVQHQLKGSFEYNGITVYIIGHLDIYYQLPDLRKKVIDLKLSSDRDTDYGEFQWKNLEHINYTQPKQYVLLVHLNTGLPVNEIPFEYHIADTSTKMRVKRIHVTVSESAIEEHKERLYHAYTGIIEALTIGYFEPKNDYDRCSVCPIKESCQYRNKQPLIEYIEI